MFPLCGCGRWEEIGVECGSLLASSFSLAGKDSSRLTA